MKRVIIILAIISAIFLRNDNGYAQGFPGVECVNCCTIIGQGQNACRVVCTETVYTILIFQGTIGGCSLTSQPGYTVTFINSNNNFCRYEIVFNIPGTYNINGTCFKVLAHPQAIIGNSNPLNVCKGASVGFINNSLNATDYIWDFGDTASGPLNTSTSTAPIVYHTYNNAGTYTVTLIASASITTNNGTHECCRDTTQLTVIVDSNEGPTVECLSPVCDNSSGTYCITNNPGGCTYTWSTNAGNTVIPAGNCATFNWTTEPLGSIILTPSGTNCCPFPSTFYVPIMPSGTFNINGNTNVCAGSIEFYNAPVIWGATYNWSITPAVPFNFPNPANPSQIAVNWPSSGTFVISCTMKNDVLDCEAVGTLTVTVQPSFTISGPTDTCVNSPVTFTSTASGTTNWTVTPAASCTSSGSTFNCTFTVPGTYTISATAPGYCNNPTATIVIHPQPPAPTVTGPSQVVPGCTYTYTATGTGTISWNVLPNTAVVVNAGNSIQVTWPSNLTTGVVQAFVIQNNCPSLPGEDSVFAIPPPTITGSDSVCSNGQNNFSLSSLPPNCTVQWSVSSAANGSVTAGQGTTSVTVDWYTVTSVTSATVTATITNSCTNTTFATLTYNVTILPAPAISISGNLLFCTGSSTIITATGGGSYAWDGAGGTNTQTFGTPGQHYVEVTDGNGCQNKKYFTLVEVPAPTVTLSTTTAVTCSGSNPNSFTLATTTASGYTVTNYTFTGPGNVPLCTGASATCFVGSPTNGTYTVSVTFSYTYNGNPVSCTRSATLTINCSNGNNPPNSCPDNPLNCHYGLSFNHISCDSVQFVINPNPPCGNFTNPDTIFLSWGDGNVVNILPFWDPGSQTYILTHAYGIPGIFHPFLSCNLGDTDIVVGGVVDFSLVRDSCGVDLLDFSSATVGNTFTFTNVNWGDGNINTQTSHTYANGGTYNVTLTYSLNGNPCTATKQITIKKPDFTIVAAPNPACVGAPVNFTVTYNAPFTVADAAFYNWDFGDTSAPAQNATVQHSYIYSGSKMVILTITDIYGCSVSDTLMLTVQDPVAYTLTSNSPQCDSVTIAIVTPSGSGNPTAVSWSPASVNSLGGFQYSVDSSGLYTATITGPNGCNTSVATNVIVFPPPNVQIFAPDSTCNPGSDTITSSASPSQFTFSWQINGITNAFTQNGTNQDIIFAPGAAGTYEVALTITSVSSPFCSATVKDTIQVFDGPTVSVTPSTFGPVCTGTPITLTATATGNAPFTYGWSSGQNTSVITTYTAGLYTVVVADVNNCTASASATANIAPLPDFAVFVRGCDTLCFGKDDTIHGPPGYMNYQFLIDNVTVQNGATSFLAKPCDQSQMSDGNPHVIKLIITTSAGCVDSSDFELKCKSCASCTCDSVDFGTLPHVSYLNTDEKKVTDSTKCDNSTTPLNLECNKTYSFDIGIVTPSGYDSCKVQDSAVLTDASNTVLISQAPISGTNPLSYTFTQSGTYCVTHYLMVNGVVCKTCVMCVQVSCPIPPACNNCPNILNSAVFNLDSLSSKNGYQLQAAYIDFSTISSFQEFSVSIADIEYSFNDSKCQDCKMHAIGRACIYPNSTTQTVGTLVLDSNSKQYLPVGSKPDKCPELVTWIPGTAATANSYSVPVQLSLPQGLIPTCCSLKINKLCLRLRIKNLDCQVCDTVICYKVPPPCCKGGKWESKSVTASGTNSNVVNGPDQILGTTAIVCGKTYTINGGTTYTFSGNYLCATGCAGQVKVRIVKPDNSVTTNNAPVNKTFNVSMPGIYKVTYLAYCGNVVCDSCTFYLDMKKDCCDKSKWQTKEITIIKPNNTSQTKALNNGSSHNTNGPATLNLLYQCAEGCAPSYSWKRWRNGVLLDSATIPASSSPITLTFAKPPSCDSIVIKAYCDGKECATLWFKLCCQPCGVIQGSLPMEGWPYDKSWPMIEEADNAVYLAGILPTKKH